MKMNMKMNVNDSMEHNSGPCNFFACVLLVTGDIYMLTNPANTCETLLYYN